MNAIFAATPSSAANTPLEKPVRRTLRSWLAPAALGLLVLTTWILRYPYRGLAHDSMLYTLLALARVHPGALGNDLFLRYGSQDEFTVFSPLYAAAIRALDLEPAAALLTFLGQTAFFIAAWVLARRLMSPQRALLAVGLLIALPSDYGAGQVFGYIEGFLTPRQAAAAFVLASVAAALAGRRVLSGFLLLAGMSLHPIMALAGGVMLLCMHVALPRPKLALALGGAAVLASVTLVLLFPFGSLHPFDEPWLKLVEFSTRYLFVLRWSVGDWGHFCVPATVLVVGALTSTTPLVRKLCSAALATVGCAILINLVYCDLLHVVLFTQIQPWRWLWLTQAMAVLLLPLILPDCWRVGLLGRATVLLVAAAYLFRDDPAALSIVLCAVACGAFAQRVQDPPYARWILLGSGALTVLALAMSISSHTLYSETIASELSLAQRVAHWLSIWGRDGLLYSAVLALAFWLGARRATSTNTFLLLSAAAVTCLVAPMGWQVWTTYQYTPAYRAACAAWRAVIPEQAQIIWPGSPVAIWYLLERQDYWSLVQSAGDIFSRQKAFEAQRRAQRVQAALRMAGPALPAASPLEITIPEGTEKLGARGAAMLCSDPELSFVVTWSRLGPTSYPEVVPNPQRPENRLRLYRCAELGQASSTAPATRESPMRGTT